MLPLTQMEKIKAYTIYHYCYIKAKNVDNLYLKLENIDDTYFKEQSWGNTQTRSG